MIKTSYFEDYEIGSSRETFGRTITEADIVLHAGQTGDFFPHHMDAEWVKTQEFKERIAHGTLILSIGIGMTANEINPVAFSYGYDRIRFIRPVYIGDTITVKATISEKRDYPKRPITVMSSSKSRSITSTARLCWPASIFIWCSARNSRLLTSAPQLDMIRMTH